MLDAAYIRRKRLARLWPVWPQYLPVTPGTPAGPQGPAGPGSLLDRCDVSSLFQLRHTTTGTYKCVWSPADGYVWQQQTIP